MALTGVTNIQIATTLVFDDGIAITISTPYFKKEIRDGEFFDEDGVQDIIHETGERLSEVIASEGLQKLHTQAILNSEPKRQNGYRSADDPFSLN